MDRCETCDQFGPIEKICRKCVDMLIDSVSGTDDALEDRYETAILHLDNVMAELRAQMRLHADQWRSKEESRHDARAKAVLAEVEEWLSDD